MTKVKTMSWVVMMVMVKMVKIEMEKKEKCSIIYNIYIYIL